MADRPPPPAPLLPPPAGYTGGRNLPSVVVAHAREVLNNSAFQYGDTDTQTVNGIDYIHRVEPHYDDHVGGYLHWHRGVTVYQPAGVDTGGGGAGGGSGAPPSGTGGGRGAPPAQKAPPTPVPITDDSIYTVEDDSEQSDQPTALYFLVAAAAGFFVARQVMAAVQGR